MTSLLNRHAGETATIVGCGLSILDLTAADFEAGPVIAINHAILQLRKLGLPNTLYSQQKDGCILHGPQVQVPINECICPFGPEMVQPEQPEELILSWAESQHCFPLYPLRHVIDVQKDFGVNWCTPSAPMAVFVAHRMGCTSLRMLGHDAYTSGDTGRIPGTATHVDRATGVDLQGGINGGYRVSGEAAQWIADKLEMSVEWVHP